MASVVLDEKEGYSSHRCLNWLVSASGVRHSGRHLGICRVGPSKRRSTVGVQVESVLRSEGLSVSGDFSRSFEKRESTVRK